MLIVSVVVAIIEPIAMIVVVTTMVIVLMTIVMVTVAILIVTIVVINALATTIIITIAAHRNHNYSHVSNRYYIPYATILLYAWL